MKEILILIMLLIFVSLFVTAMILGDSQTQKSSVFYLFRCLSLVYKLNKNPTVQQKID